MSKSRGLQASRKGDQRGARVHQHVAVLVEEGPGVGAHLVVDRAAFAPATDLRDEIGDQHGLARVRGARDDDVLGLGAFGPGDAGDGVGAQPPAARKARQEPFMGRLQPAPELSGGHHLGAPDAALADELRAAIPERDQEQPDQPRPERLAEARIDPSVGSVGDSYDNALAETINGLYKDEAIHRRGPWRSFEAVEYATLEWVDWFNNQRLLGPIGNIPPAEAEANHYADSENLNMAA